MKVSVITVAFNSVSFINDCLASVKLQKYSDIEHIIIDGASTDGTLSILESKRHQFATLISEKDRGIYHAMNKGIVLSKGEWTIFMNSGDVFINKCILEKISKKNLTTYDIIFGDTLIDHNFIKVYKKSNYFQKYTVTMPFNHQSSLVKLIYLKKNQFNLKYKLSSDFNFFLNSYSKKIKFFKYNGPISKIEASGQSDMNRQKVFNENIKIFYTKKSYLKIVFLVYYKIFEFIKNLVKFCLPLKLVRYVIKIKYYKSY